MDIKKYENILRQRHLEILARLNKIDADLSEQKSPDFEDQATQAENDEVLEEFGQVGETELKAIDAALKRIEQGTFGICVTCGQPISEERLDAVPHTPFCQDCVPG
ncbi:TraR/DksA family transcriptional regulator [Ciceribacter ferrooxidans]|uniref:TraR/DksA family transcriptional regulator n=1 Tax=Ciceribacter ferrooxidans TaxID=2509717 RepID=A0A4Q2T4N2_9HYPH|nr:TraR/DksA C4-type zinc finger protein [Ciceribacter ferrooxidans]RYC12030.1 TraR/DksA family transcriptional regulator [Ciceribacter ferrooxidans]